ncbi:hypothetical protein [Paraburkholderia terrae]|uniref:hypothetical protein n=1 Tax=Paraburkholderia terrae TaxID=311230 RepID=UPI00142DC0B0|nr:hypothetical protein [Paraburkholderia terrae]
MNDIPAGDLSAREYALENDAASLLGRMLFEFSRLDVNLGLCLVWAGDSTRQEHLTRSIENCNFKAKLGQLSKHINDKFSQHSERRDAYANWIQRADVIRQQRNALVHGRWGIQALTGLNKMTFSVVSSR